MRVNVICAAANFPVLETAMWEIREKRREKDNKEKETV